MGKDFFIFPSGRNLHSLEQYKCTKEAERMKSDGVIEARYSGTTGKHTAMVSAMLNAVGVFPASALIISEVRL